MRGIQVLHYHDAAGELGRKRTQQSGYGMKASRRSADSDNIEAARCVGDAPQDRIFLLPGFGPDHKRQSNAPVTPKDNLIMI